MSKRLPPREGEWIDRNRPVEFRFEGVAYQGFEGDVLTSALWASGVRLLGRSFKYHRPRGVYSLANHDVNVMVEDGTRTNLRGDVLPIRSGLDVRAVNTAGGLARDRLRFTEWFSAFLPVGFYYKAFHTPRRLFPFYERQMRKVAGLGRINRTARAEATPKSYATCELLVVGAGPAGLAAAIAAAECGVQVVLVDEQPHPGGSLNWQHAHDAAARRHLPALLDRAGSLDTLEVRCGTQAGGWYADHWIALFDDRRLTKLRARALLVAGGCVEQPAVFHNNDLPGVMLGSAAQRLMHLYAVKPCDRCVVLAGNSDAYAVALDLREAGVEVVGIADLRPGGETGELGQRVIAAGIKVSAGHTVFEAVPGPGKTNVAAVVLCPLDVDGKPRSDAAVRLDCDGIVMSVGWAPAGGLLYQAGARFTYVGPIEQFVPRSLPESVFAAGRVNGFFKLEDQLADGRCAGLEAAKLLGRHDGPVPPRPVQTGPPPSHPYPIFDHPKKKNFVDLDEDLHLADFVHAHQEGYDNIELLKRYTTVGMGPSQGKLANMNAVRILARLNGRSINETGTTTSRPFHQPVPMAQLAGRRFHPLRRTPVHDWHARAGAVFLYAGPWLRPEYYPVGATAPDDAIFDEALAVRNGVGLIDIGTLGKFEVSGADAAAFLERIYTGKFAQLRTGRLSYALALDESGIVIDDGLVARLGEDRFYATATTTGAAALFQEMQRWAIVWRMDVVLVNATGHWAAMNLAGPRSREVLAGLTDIDLSASAFPYLAAREGTVAGVPARLLRVGFVGELGYEIHVPAGYAMSVWTALMEAGRGHGIRPFGVEAQRLLRLEKGHIIIGQDTDALTNPYEANMAWALGKNKTFFVGQRSLAIVKKRPLERRLVGIAFPPGYAGPLPLECQLIVDGDEIVGRVTSIAGRSTVGRPIGLAFVRPDLAEPGTRVEIRSAGRLLRAAVAPVPFYDPKNERQQ
ncbi:MAG: (2Fe-2S)-binding protein [Planctomycetes bacterium]|nr:(2Fe-2S)-binding protein [Planctomycetota bacterium]